MIPRDAIMRRVVGRVFVCRVCHRSFHTTFSRHPAHRRRARRVRTPRVVFVSPRHARSLEARFTTLMSSSSCLFLLVVFATHTCLLEARFTIGALHTVSPLDMKPYADFEAPLARFSLLLKVWRRPSGGSAIYFLRSLLAALVIHAQTLLFDSLAASPHEDRLSHDLSLCYCCCCCRRRASLCRRARTIAARQHSPRFVRHRRSTAVYFAFLLVLVFSIGFLRVVVCVLLLSMCLSGAAAPPHGAHMVWDSRRDPFQTFCRVPGVTRAVPSPRSSAPSAPRSPSSPRGATRAAAGRPRRRRRPLSRYSVCSST